MNIKDAKKIVDQVGSAVSNWEFFATSSRVDSAKMEMIKNTLIHLEDIA